MGTYYQINDYHNCYFLECNDEFESLPFYAGSVLALTKTILNKFSQHVSFNSDIFLNIIHNNSFHCPECFKSLKTVFVCYELPENYISCLPFYIYQFSHEFCHYLTNKKVTQNFKWLEEAICHTSSFYMLGYIHNNVFDDLPIDALKQEILNFLIAQPLSGQAIDLTLLANPNTELSKNLFSTPTLVYSDNFFASQMLPIFAENPELFKILTKLSGLDDSMTLNQGFNYLFDSLPQSIHPELNKLKGLFF